MLKLKICLFLQRRIIGPEKNVRKIFDIFLQPLTYAFKNDNNYFSCTLLSSSPVDTTKTDSLWIIYISKYNFSYNFRVGTAEKFNLDDDSVQLVTACQCAHWFNLDTFYKEVGRVLQPGGVLALYGYNFPQIKKNNISLTKIFENVSLNLKYNFNHFISHISVHNIDLLGIFNTIRTLHF